MHSSTLIDTKTRNRQRKRCNAKLGWEIDDSDNTTKRYQAIYCIHALPFKSTKTHHRSASVRAAPLPPPPDTYVLPPVASVTSSIAAVPVLGAVAIPAIPPLAAIGVSPVATPTPLALVWLEKDKRRGSSQTYISIIWLYSNRRCGRGTSTRSRSTCMHQGSA
jgi:hypothetical protein